MDHEINCDVLVVGGGQAGCLAAIKAKEEGVDVVLAEKGWVGGSGASTFAAGDILWWTPDQDISEYIRRYCIDGVFMSDPEWLETLFKDIYKLVLEMDGWGVPFEKDSQGNFIRKPGRGHNSAVVVPGFELQRFLRSHLNKCGVKIIDRVMITKLLSDAGVVRGATGFNIRTGDFYIFNANAVILAAGGCSWKGNYFGQDMVCGEAYKIAYDVGAEFWNMEFANVYNSTSREFDGYGMSRFQRLGGRFTNALGEYFMERYDPVNKDGAHLNVLKKAMAIEVKEGRGPIYFDLSNMSEQDRELSKKMLPMFFQMCADRGIDLFSGKVEWIPGFMGSVCGSAGINLVSFDCDTNVQGLMMLF